MTAAAASNVNREIAADAVCRLQVDKQCHRRSRALGTDDLVSSDGVLRSDCSVAGGRAIRLQILQMHLPSSRATRCPFRKLDSWGLALQHPIM